VLLQLQQRILVLILAVALMAGGLFAYKQLNIEAYPDPVPPMIEIVTQNPANRRRRSSATSRLPIEVQMAGIPLRHVDPHPLADPAPPRRCEGAVRYDLRITAKPRSSWSTACRSSGRCHRRASLSSRQQPDRRDLPLPRGWPAGYSVTDLKTIQDWILLRRLKSVPGVIDITSWGGKSKTFGHHRRPDKLLAYGINLKQVHRRADRRQHQCRRQTRSISCPQSAVIRSVGTDPTPWPISATPC